MQTCQHAHKAISINLLACFLRHSCTWPLCISMETINVNWGRWIRVSLLSSPPTWLFGLHRPLHTMATLPSLEQNRAVASCKMTPCRVVGCWNTTRKIQPCINNFAFICSWHQGKQHSKVKLWQAEVFGDLVQYWKKYVFSLVFLLKGNASATFS